MSVEILLSDEQLALAMVEAERRQTVNEAKRLRGRNRAPARGDAALEMHKLGCTGEFAVAVFLGMQEHVFQEQAARAGSVDLPGNIEVKTRSKHGYDLLIQLDDDPNKLFVLATCNRALDARRVIISGWAYGKDVMKRELVREFVRGRPCYAVPQSILKPIESLEQETSREQPPARVLASDEAWITEEDEEMFLNISDALADQLGWKPGDTLEWRVDQQNNCCYLKKVDDSKAPIT